MKAASLVCVPIAAVAAAASLLAGCGGGQETPSRPQEPQRGLNVLLITLDTTRADRLGCYGYAKAETPALVREAFETDNPLGRYVLVRDGNVVGAGTVVS